MISFSSEQLYIVTGASSGIGEGIALLLNELGASVVAMGRNKERLDALKAKAASPDNIFIEAKDLAEDIARLPDYATELRKKYGKFSGMAYSAGVTAVAPVQVFDYDYARRIFDINYFAPIMLTKGLLDRRNNIGKGASFVYLSSLDAFVSTRGQSLYAGSKSALSATVKGMAREVAQRGIRMNSLLPSMIKTPMTTSEESDKYGAKETVDEQHPFGWGEVSDVASFAVFLLSNKAKYLSGQKYIVDSGGML